MLFVKFVSGRAPSYGNGYIYTAIRETPPPCKLDLLNERGKSYHPYRGVKLPPLSRGSALFGNQVWRFKSFPKVFLTEPQQCARYIKAHLRGPVSHVLPLQSLGSEWGIGRDLVASLQIFQFKVSSAGEGK